MNSLMPELVWLLVLVIFFVRSIKIVREDHRLAVFRLGRYMGVKGPGMVILIPFVDKGQDVNLSEQVPGWQGLSPRELEERIISTVLNRSWSDGQVLDYARKNNGGDVLRLFRKLSSESFCC